MPCKRLAHTRWSNRAAEPPRTRWRSSAQPASLDAAVLMAITPVGPGSRRGAGHGVRRARETGIPHRCDEHGSLHVGFAGFDMKTGDSMNSFGAVFRLVLEHS